MIEKLTRQEIEEKLQRVEEQRLYESFGVDQEAYYDLMERRSRLLTMLREFKEAESDTA